MSLQVSRNRGITSAQAVPAALSLKQKAYEAIKHRIITCAFRPGETLNESAVASLLALGRTPVHQAFDRLRLEGLVDVLPRKGVVVRPLVLEEVIQISEARLLNEAYAVRLAAERASPSEIARMREILTRAATPALQTEELMLLDREFHKLIAEAAKNSILADILLNLNERSLRLWTISFESVDRQTIINNEHREIFLAICQRDAVGAESAMRQHIGSFRQTVLEQLSSGMI
jgi:DNA-binding GntR family transcriptional regulator